MKILGAIGRRMFHRLKAYTDAIAQGIDTNNDKQVKENIAELLVYILVQVLIWLIPLVIMAAISVNIAEMYLTASGFLLLVGIVAACGSASDGESEEEEQASTPVDIAMAKEDAEIDHDDLRNLVFNAIVDTSESTSLKRPSDEYRIETSRDKPYHLEDALAIHQFEVDVDAPVDRIERDKIWGCIQTHINRRARRYSNLVKDGHVPVVYDVKNGGGFLIVEVVLYSEKYKDKIERRRKARFTRQQRAVDTYDPDT